MFCLNRQIHSTIKIRMDGNYYSLEEINPDKRDEISKKLLYRAASISGLEASQIKEENH